MKKNILLTSLLLCAITIVVKSQNIKMDSLKMVLKNTIPDTTRINTLNILAKTISNANPDSTILLARQALSLITHLPLEFVKDKSWVLKAQANAQYYMSWGYSYRGNDDTVMILCNQALANY